MTTLPIPEAATRLHVSQATVRRRIRNGQLPATQTPTPQGFTWQVDIPADAPEAAAHDPGENGTLETLVTTLQAQVLAQAEELAARRREVQELHVLLQQSHQLALPSPEARPGLLKRFWHNIIG